MKRGLKKLMAGIVIVSLYFLWAEAVYADPKPYYPKNNDRYISVLKENFKPCSLAVLGALLSGAISQSVETPAAKPKDTPSLAVLGALLSGAISQSVETPAAKPTKDTPQTAQTPAYDVDITINNFRYAVGVDLNKNEIITNISGPGLHTPVSGYIFNCDTKTITYIPYSYNTEDKRVTLAYSSHPKSEYQQAFKIMFDTVTAIRGKSAGLLSDYQEKKLEGFLLYYIFTHKIIQGD